jgi:hypothetical protein
MQQLKTQIDIEEVDQDFSLYDGIMETYGFFFNFKTYINKLSVTYYIHYNKDTTCLVYNNYIHMCHPNLPLPNDLFPFPYPPTWI